VRFGDGRRSRAGALFADADRGSPFKPVQTCRWLRASGEAPAIDSQRWCQPVRW